MSKGDFVMRKSGILMHITSLPGNYGIGTMARVLLILWTFWRSPASRAGRSSR